MFPDHFQGRLNTINWPLVRFAIAALLLLITSFLSAQQVTPARVGLLVVSEREGRVLAFRQALRDFGLIEGRDFVIEYRSAKGQTKNLDQLAIELLKADVDVLVTHSTPGVRAAKKATSKVPIVMASVGNAVESGLVRSFSRPGANVTGISFFGAELSIKRLEVMKDILPTASRMAFLAHRSAPTASKNRAISAAKSLGIDAQLFEVTRPSEFTQIFATMKAQGVKAVVLLGSPILFTNRRVLIEQAAIFALPVIYPWRDATEEGGLMSLGPDHDELWRHAASFVRKILKGSKPADIPVERPKEFELLVNSKTAKALGIQLPTSVLLRAQKVI